MSRQRTDYADQVGRAVAALKVNSLSSFSWFGRPVRTLASHDRDVIPEEAQSSILLQSIKSVLYDCFYCPGIPTPLEFILEQTRAGVQIEEAWSATNNGGGHWQPGWRVVAAGDKSVIAERRDLKVRVAKAETSKGADGEFAVGDEISVRHPKELRTFSPGFFYIVGDQPISAEDRDQLLRVYWNLTPSIAADFIGVLTRALNDLGVPFQFKVWKNVGARMRCDSGVLYLSRRHYAQARPALESIHRSLGDQLNPGEPAFCKVLAPGVGLAEDPGSNKSFGMHRCELTAKGVIGAHQLGERRLPERLERVREAFRSSQVVFDQPYLQPGSIDAYRFVSTTTKSTKVTTPRSDNVANNSVETAAVIGRLLCDRAIWADGRCCWIGPARPGGPTGLSALGPDIYSGTAGVALFLATLGSLTNEPTAKSTALAAIRHATEHVDDIPDRAIGFYSGSAGVAFAAYHVGTLLEDDELHDAGIEVLKRLPDPDSITEPDLISGHAGLIVAVGALNGASRLPWLANRIRSHGDELLGSARTQKDRLFWRSGANRRGLLGMAHGTSGIGWALVELFALTGDDRYAEAAHAAFRYDNAAFDPDRQKLARSSLSQRSRRGHARGIHTFLVSWVGGHRTKPTTSASHTPTARIRGRLCHGWKSRCRWSCQWP